MLPKKEPDRDQHTAPAIRVGLAASQHAAFNNQLVFCLFPVDSLRWVFSASEANKKPAGRAFTSLTRRNGQQPRDFYSKLAGYRLLSSLPFGLPSPPPLPKPLLPRGPLPLPLLDGPCCPADCATAGEFNEVDKSIVIAGGVTAANFPHVARNLRRSSSAWSVGRFSDGISLSYWIL